MSGLVNKIKDAVHGDKKHEQPTGTSGPHDSRTANAADPRVDSDRDHRANPATGTTGTYGSSTTGTTGGAGLGGDNFSHSGTGVTGAPGGHSNTLGSSGVGNTSTNRGPHDSNLANKADPRVDSDRDHRAAGGLGSTTGSSGFGSSNTAYGTTGTTGTSGLGSSNHGPHDSNLANKADPRVDSDRDHRAGGIGATTGAGEFGSSHTTGAGEFGSSTAGRTTRSGAEYGSGLGSSNTAYGTTGTTGTTGTSGLGSSNRGPHDSNLANKADPRVDSDRDHRAAPGSTGVTGNNYGTTGSSGLHGTTGTSGLSGNPGPAPNTAGPHKSDMLNKVDPRVDSDRDGSKTLGQDQTYARSSNTTSNVPKDPTDAAQVPPSVLAKHVGEPAVEHGDHGHDRARRNSTVTHQEAHRGL